ncbi:MAG TPA: glucodextranase DOMON-like domain-containing protein [Casimicrobiaceae bacterium]|nr:glucodextranase DOMON-like domain-containing protein [Casimicrobiaceae bacterium]
MKRQAYRQSSRRFVASPHAESHSTCAYALLAIVVSLLWVVAIGDARAQPAPDGPGSVSHHAVARKDCFGTARNTISKVWYTVAGGVLSDVYYPTIDNSNVETLQYIVTDGSTFTDLQARDMSYTVRALDPGGIECRVTTSAKSGKYQIITDYVTDPARNALLARVSFEPQVKGLHLYVRFDPSVNGNGGGGAANGGPDGAVIDTSNGHPVLVAFDPATATNATNRDYAQPVYVALDASTPMGAVTVGFAGAGSDGLVQLDLAHTLTAAYTQAGPGNVVETAEVVLSRDNTFTLALGFGSSQSEAVNVAEASLADGFPAARKSYEREWATYDASLNPPPSSIAGLTKKRAKELGDLYYFSANVIKAAEDKTFPGAIVASPAAPWGQAVSAADPANTFFGSYREVRPRDLYSAATSLLLAGDVATARDATRFLFAQQLADGSMPRSSLLNAKAAPDSFNTQLDETAFAILAADQLGVSDAASYANHIKPAAAFLVAHGPSFGPERWEEQAGYSPSTIAAEIAGLVAAGHLAQLNGDTVSSNVFLGVADDYQRSVIGWTATTNGPLASSPYFIRLSKTGDPDAAISYNLGNGGPTLDQRAVIDPGFLELSRLGVFSATLPVIVNTLPIVDNKLRSVTAAGPAWHRYSGDGYGDRATDGRPWAPTASGSGHVWPELSAERAANLVQVGDLASAASIIDAMARLAGGVGLIPEQDWELPDLAASPFGTDPTVASIGFTNGQPDGSAAPLVRSAATFVRILSDLGAGRIVEQPSATFSRYVANTQGATNLTVTSPPDESAVNTSTVTISGTTAPGNSVYIAATNIDTFETTTASGIAGGGSFDIPVSISGGTTVINTVAVSQSGATAHDKRAIVFDFTPGTVLLDVTDPSGDDNGPGNYAYPTAADFRPGAFDIQEFKVILSPDGSTVTFKLRVRDLTPTFGSPLGAQLIDVYVHNPGAAVADTSTVASFSQRNYMIAAGSAWSRLLEVQGFGQRYVDAHGTSLGTIAISGNAISRFITFSVPTVSLGGSPGPGWGFTVTLTGQDGFSPDQARGFSSTPQPFAFGVCATASSDAHCTVDPATVPKLIDVLTPPGVSQSDELDYTVHSTVTLQGVFIP